MPSDEPPPALTPRQWEIVALVVEGLSNRAIALKLSISKRTVEAHLAMIALRLPGSMPPRECILVYELARVRREALKAA